MSSYDTTFVPKSTVITSTWLQSINDSVWEARDPLYATTGGTGTAYVLTLPSGSLYTTLAAGDTFTWKAHATNTGAATLTIVGGASLGPKSLTKNGTTPLVAGDITSGAIIGVVYDGTEFQLTQGVKGGSVVSNPNFVTSTHTGGAYTITLPAGSGYTTATAGDTFTFKADATCPGACTLTVVGDATVGPYTMTGIGGTMTLSAGDFVQFQIMTVVYGGGSIWQIQEVPPFTYNVGSTLLRTMQDKCRDLVTPEDFGAIGDGTTNDSTAIQNSVSGGTAVGGPRSNYKTNTAITGAYTFSSFAGTFSGTHPMDEDYPAFGPGSFRSISKGSGTADMANGIIGIVNNDLNANTTAYPCGVTGYGRTNKAGNTAFGLFGQAALYNTGVATNEMNSMNFYAAPTTTLPVNRGIGTTEKLPICLTVAAGGSYNSAIGIQICKEGSLPRQFQNAFYVNSDCYVNSAIYIAAPSSGGVNSTSVFVENEGTGINLTLKTMNSATAGNAVFTVLNTSEVTQMAIRQNGRLTFKTGITQSTVGAAGGASALPATPLGYLQIELLSGLTPYVIPYYNAS